MIRERHIETLKRLIARTYAEVAADRTLYERSRSAHFNSSKG